MPIYEYRCKSCNHEFEELMKLSDPDPRCPVCEFEAVEKLMSAGAIRGDANSLYGGGFEAPGRRPLG